MVFIRNRLKYALTYHEVKMILKQRQVKVDNKVRTDVTYPAGFMGALIWAACVPVGIIYFLFIMIIFFKKTNKYDIITIII